MRTELKCTLIVILLACTAISVVRIVRLHQRLKQAARFSVLDSDTACGKTDTHTLQIDLIMPKSSGRAAIALNGNMSSWDTIGPTLKGLFSTRVDKFVYLRSAAGVSSSDDSEMFHLIESAGAERLCSLDSNAPNKYVPLIVGSAPVE
jgi:hypothetical protein